MVVVDYDKSAYLTNEDGGSIHVYLFEKPRFFVNDGEVLLILDDPSKESPVECRSVDVESDPEFFVNSVVSLLQEYEFPEEKDIELTSDGFIEFLKNGESVHQISISDLEDRDEATGFLMYVFDWCYDE